MKRHYSLHVHGQNKHWSFDIYTEPGHVKAWREDGLEIAEVVGSCPGWVAELGLSRIWLFVQDVINFRFKKGG